jgi:hypothetical protein
MAYTAETITTGDSILATWGNKVETNLDRVGEYMGVVANVASLPAVGDVGEGDWYWCKAERLAKMKVGSVYLTLNGVGEVASSAPTTVTGLLWYDTTNKVFKIYSGSAWVQIGESLIDTSQAVSSLQSALIAQNPSLLINVIANSDLWDYLLKNSTVRTEVVKYKMYLDAMLGIGSAGLSEDTVMKAAMLDSTEKLVKCFSLDSFWLNSDILTYAMNNVFTKFTYDAYSTITVQSINSKYGFRIYSSNIYSGENLPYLGISLDLTSISTISFWYSFTEYSSGGYGYVYIDSDLKKTYNTNQAGASDSVDVSGYTGTHTLKFKANRYVTAFDFTSIVLS